MKKTVRVAIGTPDFPHSSIWSTTSNRSEVYLSERSSYAISKISLHSSGLSRFAINELHSKNRLDDRALSKWLRPPQLAPDWWMGVSLVFPGMGGRSILIPAEQCNKQVSWLIAPSEYEERCLAIFFSKNQQDLSFAASVLGLHFDWTARLPLEPNEKIDADTVWIASWIQPLEKIVSEQALDLTSNILIDHRGKDFSGFATAFKFYPRPKQELEKGFPPWFLVVTLGEDNLKK
ncbi:MAG: hypothetical protein R3B52_01030 [Candidatus Paceibacterota bacterium]